MRKSLLASLALTLGACNFGDFQLEEMTPVPVGSPAALDCTFRGGVLPTLRSSAAGHGCTLDCHTPALHYSGLVLATSDEAVYSNLQRGGTRYGTAVVTGAPKTSPILFVPLQSADPGDPTPDASHPKKPFATEHVTEYQAIQCWIEAGGQDD